MIIIQEMGRSYLCTDIMEDGECSYMERMLTDNVISGQPVCRRGIFQNRDVLKYDITNMKNICREYESKTMSFAELRGLLQGIAEQLCNGAAYLLDEEYYVFDPEYIYIDMETGRLNLICVPYKCRENDIEERFHKLADFILEKIEHKEEHAASIAYQFYRMSKERLFSIVGFCSIIEKENDLANREDGRIRRGAVTSGRIPDEGYEPGKEKDLDPYEGSWDEEERSADQNRNPRLLPILAGITGVLGIAALGLYLTVGKRSPYNIQILCAAVILPGTALLIGIKLLIGFVTSKKEKELEDEMTGRTVTVNEYWGGEERTVFFDEETQLFDPDEKDGFYVEWDENGEEKREDIGKRSVILGKKFDEVDVCVSDPTVSRKHAKLTIRSGEVFLQDLGSTNGTFVNGVKITPGEDIKLCNNKDFLLGKVAVRVV